MSTRSTGISRGAKAIVGIAILFVIAAVTVRALVREDAPPASNGAAAEGMAGMEGMDMSTAAGVRLTPEQVRDFGITFDYVEERQLSYEVRTVGIVDFDETRVTAVAFRFGGFIERLFVDFTGKPVRRGDPLVEIYSPELVAAQEDLLLAARLDRTVGETSVPGVAVSSDLLGAARRRLRLWDITDAQIDEILNTGVAQRTLVVHAPFSGVVIEKNVVAGQAVQAGQTLYTVADLSRVWVEAELREADAGLVREGSTASIELGALPGERLEGRVEYVYPTLRTDARTLEARIAIANPHGRLKPGMFATVRLSAPTVRTLAIPVTAILRTGERQIVFADTGAGQLMPFEVETGRIAGDYAEVLSGLEPGQRVVTSAQFLIDSESNLAEVMKAMMGQMNPSDMGSMPKGADMSGMDMSGKEH